jgi:hypothetical protein
VQARLGSFKQSLSTLAAALQISGAELSVERRHIRDCGAWCGSSTSPYRMDWDPQSPMAMSSRSLVRETCYWLETSERNRRNA